MNVIKKLFSKKNRGQLQDSTVPDPTEPGALGSAEQIAIVVEDGLGSEDFSAMSRRLSSIAERERREIEYAFSHPGAKGEVAGIVACVVLSVASAFLVVIGIVTAILSGEHRLLGLAIAIASAALIVGNVRLARKLADVRTFQRRYNAYFDVLNLKDVELVAVLADCAGSDVQSTVIDLRRAMEEKLIPQGHFTTDDAAFIVSDDAFGRYEENRVAYDRYLQNRLSERERTSTRPERVSQVLEEGDRYLEKLRGYKDLVKGKAALEDIAELERVASMIFREVSMNYDSVLSLGSFLNYYLPTSERLLDTYVTLEEKKAEGRSAANAIKEIERALGSLLTAYKGILERIYREYEAEVASDVEALEMSIRQEGLPV